MESINKDRASFAILAGCSFLKAKATFTAVLLHVIGTSVKNVLSSKLLRAMKVTH